MSATTGYYVPHDAKWSIVGSVGLFIFFIGMALLVNGGSSLTMFAGMAVVIYMMFGWFGMVVRESESGIYKAQEDLSFRMSMAWFIFSEVMFFAAFFGALFYARTFSGPWLGDIGSATNTVLYSHFDYVWPNNGPGNLGGDYLQMGWFGLPLINTLLLLTSGVTCTMAHHAIQKGHRETMVKWLLATVILGFVFVACQGFEYYEAYHHNNLKMTTGIYGSTFFMLTGFHGFHVCMGAIILTVVMIRGHKGHFTADNHFAFEAAAWYWHFVDVVWLGLFLFVYIL